MIPANFNQTMDLSTYYFEQNQCKSLQFKLVLPKTLFSEIIQCPFSILNRPFEPEEFKDRNNPFFNAALASCLQKAHHGTQVRLLKWSQCDNRYVNTAQVTEVKIVSSSVYFIPRTVWFHL